MGKDKKRFNWKARQLVKTDIDKTEQNKIKVDLQTSSNYDDCNALVLPSQKRKTKIKKESGTPSKRMLSKKQRKKLEKIIERKKLKENRASMLEALAKVQLPEEQMKLMTSITEVQTKGLKKLLSEGEKRLRKIESESGSGTVVNAVRGSRKRRKLLLALMAEPKEKRPYNPNIVGIESSSEDSSSDSDANIKTEPEEIMEIEAEDTELEEKLNKESNEETEAVGSKKEVEIKEDENKEESEVLGNKQEEETKEEEDKEDSEVVGNKQEVETKEEENKEEAVQVTTLKENNPVSKTKSPLPEVTKEVIKTEATTEDSVKKKSAIFVSVARSPDIEEGRRKLPILGEEQVIMEAIAENPVVILAGETGSGKTTQVPQFLYEAGYTSEGRMIGVTEPRRVAAVAMSKRVGFELGLGEDVVSYLVRFEGNTTPKTQIKFMTDGVLLKEIQSDFLLTRYSVVIVDEAHERSVSTDVALGLLSRIVNLRHKRGDPLKLIVMSATLRINDFTENSHLFPKTPTVVKVESRQFPVTVHFNKRTNPDYVKEAFRKVRRIHSELPDGGILVFLTGRQEVMSLVKKLRASFPMKKNEEEEEEAPTKKHKSRKVQPALPTIDLDRYDCVGGGDEAEECDDDEDNAGDDSEDDELWERDDATCPTTSQPLWTLPLYSLLPSYKQAKVFKGAPQGARLCVVSTNVAETSLTIPGVKYVVDCGKAKRKVQDRMTGVTAFLVSWASKAEAAQRAGRAGRQSPGHCYRLYSSAVFNDEFPEWAEPEIKRRAVDDLVLNMKALGIHRVAGFPFPTPPDKEQLEIAERTLILLGAIVRPVPGKDKWDGKITALGESMSALPLGPRFARMVCLSHQHNLTPYCLTIVAGLSVQELLLPPDQQVKKARRKIAGHFNSHLLGDVMVVLKSICNGGKEGLVAELGLREQALKEAMSLRAQLANQLAASCPQLNISLDLNLKPPSDPQARLLRQIVTSGGVDRIGRLVEEETVGGSGSKKKRAEYETLEMEQRVQISRDSVLSAARPQWVVYQDLYTSSTSNSIYMRCVTAIEPQWLIKFVPGLCQTSAPLDDPPPAYNRSSGKLYCHLTATFGKRGWEIPKSEVEMPTGLDRYKWFAVFFLEGSVCPKLVKYVPSLLSTPHTMVKPWAKLQPRTELLLKTLVSKEVDSKQKLLECWKSDKFFLMSAYQNWLPESASNEIAAMWPPT